MRDEFGMPRRYVYVEREGGIQSAYVRYLRHYYERYRMGVPRPWGKFISEDWASLDPPAFSHKVVDWERFDGKYIIFPRKGEVWAIRADNATTLFRGATPTLIKYHMVEVLKTYVEYTGMKIVYLVRVEGGRHNCFRRCQRELHVRPKYVLERFSHQVPSVRVSGEDSMNGWLELDPSSLPLYVDEFGSTVEPEISDNYLFLGLLDRKVCNEDGTSFIWVAYDYQCQVPLMYVDLRSERPFGDRRLIMHELVPCPTYENEKKWQESGLPIACGKFIISPVETEKRFSLSHRFHVWHSDCNKIEGVTYINIHPKEGEVWGIYKDRDLVMACNPKAALEYQIVAIVEKKEKNVKVACLLRVEGFKGLFRKDCDHASKAEFLIPVHEFCRFSHQIPFYRFDETCSKEFLRGAFVLDPLLLPQKLGYCFSFSDPFLLERSYVSPRWSAIQFIVGKLRNDISLDSKENSCNRPENCIVDLTIEQEGIIVENSQEGELNLGEITPTEIHGSESMESEAVKHDNNLHLNIKFHDFDDHASERNFELGQVWALFRGSDGLPCYYARIDKFLNSGGTIEVTILEPHPVADEEMHWVEENLPMACGTFRASRSTRIKERTVFSHRVICAGEQPSKLFYRVYPRKGEVWAIYRHWNVNWKFSEMKNNIRYKLVEVVSDFTEEAGITVAALVRVEGHEDVFRRQLHEGFWLFMTYKRKELLRFSHCIPSLIMTGDQDGSTPEDLIKIKFCHDGI